MAKKRNWACVFYPESLPDDWIDLLQQKGIAFCISPLHNQDVNPDGTIKKEHYHVILCFDGPTTDKNVKSICDELNQPRPIAIESVRGYYRYLTHKDNPDKFQYDESLIRCFNGFDELYFINDTDEFYYLGLIFDIIHQLDILEFSQLIDYLKNENYQLWTLAVKKHQVLNTYLTSKRCCAKIEVSTKKLP